MKVFLISIIVVILDQITKLTVRYYCEYEHRYKIIGDWIRLTYIENQGMAFGIQVGGGQPFFTIFAVIATVIIFVYILKARDEKLSLRFALALILGGAIGNLIDRFLYGAVVDFVDIGFGTTRWPIFNVADSAVTIGMMILIVFVVFDKSSKQTDETAQVAAENRA